MTHPTYPNRERTTDAIAKALGEGKSMSEIQELIAQHNDERDRQFPGWRERYSRQMHEWLQAQRAPELAMQTNHRGARE